MLLSPEVASFANAVTVTGAVLYHPPKPSAEGRVTAMAGPVASTLTVCIDEVDTLPALSTALNETVCVPSVETVTELPACNAPLSTEYCTLPSPEVTSAAPEFI